MIDKGTYTQLENSEEINDIPRKGVKICTITYADGDSSGYHSYKLVHKDKSVKTYILGTAPKCYETNEEATNKNK